MKSFPRLKYERQLRGWSQNRLAQEIGTTPNSVSLWERGLANPSPYFLEKLCLLFNLTTSELERIPSQSSGISSDSPINVLTTGEKLQAAFSYTFIWITGLFLLFLRRKNCFVRFHAAQSVLFFGALTMLYVACEAMGWLLYKHRQSAKLLSSLHILYIIEGRLLVLFFILKVSLCVFALIYWSSAIKNASYGKYYKLPIIGTWIEQRVR